MDDATSSELLREHVAWGVRPGARVVLCSAIEGAGADVEAFARYVERQGGVHVPGSAPYWLLADPVQ